MRVQAFDYSVNLLQAILWQYNDAERLQTLLAEKQVWYDENQTAFWEDWFHDVFNLQSCNAFGLDVWSIILDIPLQLGPSININKPIFGFNNLVPENNYKNLNNGNFVRPGAVIPFTIPQRRLLLRLRYFQLITRGAVLEINKFLKEVFAEPGLNYTGNVYVLDGLDMSMTYVFTAYVPSQLIYMFQNYDILPRPAGVLRKIIVATGKVFGFGAFNQNFGNGNFMEVF
jgi:hypothetical protein